MVRSVGRCLIWTGLLKSYENIIQFGILFRNDVLLAWLWFNRFA